MNTSGIKIAIRLLPLTVCLLAIVQIIVTNQFAGSGKTLSEFNIAIDTIRLENERLEQRVASASSLLLTIASKAHEVGFIEPMKSQYLTIVPEQLPVAFNVPK